MSSPGLQMDGGVAGLEMPRPRLPHQVAAERKPEVLLADLPIGVLD